MADYRCCLISFTRTTSLGSQVVPGVADEQGAFEPTGAILWSTQQAVDGFTSNGTLSLHITYPPQGGIFSRGWTNTQITNSTTLRAAMNTLYAFMSYWDSLSQPNNSASWTGSALGQFTLSWNQIDTASGRSPCQIFALVFGGIDFAMRVGHQVKTAIGTQALNTVPFTPSGGLTMAVATVREIQTYAPGVSIDNLPALGVLTEDFQGVSGGTAEGGLTFGRFQRTDRSSMMYNILGPGIRSAANRVSMDAAGWTQDWTQVPVFGSGNDPYGDPGYYYAAFGGTLPVAAGSFLQASGTISIPLSGRPGAVIIWSHNSPAGTAVLTNGKYFSFGAVDAVGTQLSSWHGANSNASLIRSARGMFQTQAITCAEPSGTAASPTATLTAAATVEITDTGFDVIFTTSDGSPREFLYLAFGVSAEPPPPPPPPPIDCQVGHGYCTPTAVATRTGM